MKQVRPYVFGVAGGSGSGKSTIVRKILEQIEGEDAVVIQHDSYYKDLSHLGLEERTTINFDHPDSLDSPLLISHLKELLEGRPVMIPEYDFSQHERTTSPRLVNPCRVIIVEGILIFDNEELRNTMDMKIFVDTDSDIRFIRRLQRDIQERGRTADSVIKQYLHTVKPMHERFVDPGKKYADIIIPEGGQNHVGIDLIVSKIRATLSFTDE